MSQPSSDNRFPMRRPLLALALAFAAGIWLQESWEVPAWALLASVAGMIAAAAVLALVRWGGPLRYFLWLVCVLAVGMLRVGAPHAPLADGFLPGRHVITGVARGSWDLGQQTKRLELDLESVGELGGPAKPFRGRMLLSVVDPPWSGESSPNETQEKASHCPRILPGDRLRAYASIHQPQSFHNPGVMDYEKLMLRRGIDWRGTARSCLDVLVQARAEPFSVDRWIERWRAETTEFILGQPGSTQGRGVLVALTTGDEGGVGQPLWKDFQESGLAHLLSISGLHLAIVALGIFAGLRKVLVRIPRLPLCVDIRRVAALAAIPVTLWYVWMAGAQLPAIRSAVMVVCFLLAVVGRRDSDPLQTLSVAAFIVLGVWPHALFEASFQLSFVAVASMLLVVPAWSRMLGIPLRQRDLPKANLKRWWIRLVQYLLVSLAATLGTAPLVAYHFHQATWIGLLSNLVAVPLTTLLIVPVGLALNILTPVCGVAAAGLAFLGVGLADLLCWLAHFFASWPGASFHVASPSTVEIILWYSAFFLFCFWQTGHWVRYAILIAIGGLGILWLVSACGPRFSDELQVTFVDVGQGDATLVRFPGGSNMLVDGGGSAYGNFDIGAQVVLPFLWEQGVSQLDWVVLTHSHPDHFGGLVSVVREMKPRELWCYQDLGPDERLAPLAQAAQEAGTTVVRINSQQAALMVGGAQVSVLWPPPGEEAPTENDQSLVLQISYGRRTVLLAGDIQEGAEQGLLLSQKLHSVDVLKVAHHGSGFSSSEDFLHEVRPSLSVVSVGAKNAFGLPEQKTIDRIHQTGSGILRTDCHGAVSIRTDGQKLDWDTAQGAGEDGFTCRGSTSND